MTFGLRDMSWRSGFAAAICLLGTTALADDLPRAQAVSALQDLRSIAELAISEAKRPGGAIVVDHDDEIVFLEGFDLREAGKPAKVDPDTVFQLASRSKPIS